MIWIDATGCCAPFHKAFRCGYMAAGCVQDAGYRVGMHRKGQRGGGCEYGREFVTPVDIESPAWRGGPNKTKAVLDCAVVDEVIGGLVFG
jgi:hypothetical protein